jgi:mRNA interferase YafQ
MKYAILQTTRYKKELQKALKRGHDINLIKAVVLKLANGDPLGPKHKDHPLSGSFSGFRECHITPDWLLVYLIENERLTLTLTRTGSHSDLF